MASGAGSEGLKSCDCELLQGQGQCNGKGSGRAVRQEDGFKKCDWEMSQEKGKGKGRGRAVTGLKTSDRGVPQGQGQRCDRTAAVGMSSSQVTGGCHRDRGRDMVGRWRPVGVVQTQLPATCESAVLLL